MHSALEASRTLLSTLRATGVDFVHWKSNHHLAEALAAQVVALAGSYSHIAFPATASGKNVAPRVAALLDVGPVERSGDPNTVNATGGAAFKQTAGASFREILDVSDWDNSVAINVPGQSAQPQSKHYSDLLPLWAEGRYFPWLYTKEKVEKNSPDKLVLMPAR